MKLRGTDSARLVLLYESSVMIVLSTIDGSIIKTSWGTTTQCSKGCTVRYDSNLIYFFGPYRISSTDYLGMNSFDPDIQNPPSSF